MTKDRGPCGVTACGLCAGETLGERPDGQLARLRDLEEAGLARLRVVECLDQCERGDVVVVRPSGEGRRAGGRPTWFSGVAGDPLTEDLGEWLADGGPGVATVPPALAGRVIRRPKG